MKWKLLYHNRIYIGVIFIGIMEKKMEPTAWGLGFREDSFHA